MSSAIAKLNRAKSNPKPIQPRNDNKTPMPVRPSFVSTLLMPSNSTPRVELTVERSESSQSEMSGSEASKVQLLTMEIKQLKRQNQFLKKKIQEMTMPQQNYQRKKNSKLQSQLEQPQIDPIHRNLNYFFRQIGGLFDSLSSLFHIDSSSLSQINQLKHLPCETNPHKISKINFSRKLEKLMMLPEENKYQNLLEIFTEYYTMRQQNEINLLRGLEGQLQKVKQLHQWLLEKAQNRKMKSSLIHCASQKQNTTVGEQDKATDSLKVPETPSHHSRLTFSPNAKTRGSYKRNVDRSPL